MNNRFSLCAYIYSNIIKKIQKKRQLFFANKCKILIISDSALLL